MNGGRSDSQDEQNRSKRRFPRRTVRIEVEYDSPGTGAVREYATTLGAGGLFIQSEAPLPRRTRIKLAFSLPGLTRRHEIEGRVVWMTDPGHPGETPGMGIQFTNRTGAALLARDLEDWEPTSKS